VYDLEEPSASEIRISHEEINKDVSHSNQNNKKQEIFFPIVYFCKKLNKNL
jgi:hypothetical protein